MGLKPKITVVRVSAVPFIGFYYFVSSSLIGTDHWKTYWGRGKYKKNIHAREN